MVRFRPAKWSAILSSHDIRSWRWRQKAGIAFRPMHSMPGEERISLLRRSDSKVARTCLIGAIEIRLGRKKRQKKGRQKPSFFFAWLL